MGKAHDFYARNFYAEADLDVGLIRQIGLRGSMTSSRSISKVAIVPIGAASTRQRIREPSSGR